MPRNPRRSANLSWERNCENPPWNVAVGAEYKFIVADHKSYVRFDYEFTSRNPWSAAIQDPRSSQFTPFPTPQSYTLPSTTFLQFRAGTTFGAWETSFFVDNLLNSHTTTNYERTFTDGNNPNFPPPGPQYNNYTFRPRTFGITASFRE